MNDIMKFENHDVEIIKINGEPYFEVYSTGMALGQIKSVVRNGQTYYYPRNERIDENLKSASITPCVRNGHSYINEPQLYDLMLEMKTDKCRPFRKWVTSEVLPSIRKTGTYSIPDKNKESLAEAKLLNARARVSAQWLKIAGQVNQPEYKQICAHYASGVLSNQPVIPLPVSEQRYYSAKEMGEMFGITAQKIGLLSNQHELKTDRYGKWFHDKSRYSNKEVDSFRYNDQAVEAFRQIVGGTKN